VTYLSQPWETSLNKSNFFLNVAGLMCATLVSIPTMAQTASVPDHPRENEVNQRLDNQQARINQGLANGTMNGRQAARDEKHDANIAQREALDESKHNGHITKAEQNRLNKSENRNSRRIYRQKHS
jgi:ABC-type transport system involved in cytochrome bd biosynthesis fused ATPase/permease subunit